MGSIAIRVLLFTVILYETRGESEKYNHSLTNDRRNGYEESSDLVKTMQSVVQNTSPVNDPLKNVVDLLQLEFQRSEEYLKNIRNESSVVQNTSPVIDPLKNVVDLLQLEFRRREEYLKNLRNESSVVKNTSPVIDPLKNIVDLLQLEFQRSEEYLKNLRNETSVVQNTSPVNDPLKNVVDLLQLEFQRSEEYLKNLRNETSVVQNTSPVNDPLKNVVDLLQLEFQRSEEYLKNFRNESSVVQNTSPVIDPPITIVDLLQLEFRRSEEYLENLGNESSVCSSDLSYVLQHLKEKWAQKMIDSYGKVGSGVLGGNLAWLGSYDECIEVHATSTKGNFQGKYCTITWSILLSETSEPVTVSTGACIPNTCSSSQVYQIYVKILQTPGIFSYLKEVFSYVNITSINNCKPLSKELTTPAIFMIYLMSFFGVMALLGSSITIYAYFRYIPKKQTYSYSRGNNFHKKAEATIKIKKGSTENLLQTTSDEDTLKFIALQNNNGVFKKLKPILKSFCVFTNGAAILNTDAIEGQFLCLNGIRFLTLTWVILGHTYTFIATGVNINNPLEAVTEMDSLAFQIVFQSIYAVDAFFVLSGFLQAYSYTKERNERRGIMGWVYFYTHRYLRLTPMYMIVLGFFATLSRYISFGPYTPTSFVDENCEKYWWRNILYINNLYSISTMCMGYSWYLADDMQFFVFSPLILYMLWKRPKIGFSIIGSLLTATTICRWVISYENNITPGFSQYIQNAESKNYKSYELELQDYIDIMYNKPYTRIGPYLIGILLGHVLIKYKKSLSMMMLYSGWIISTLLAYLIIFGLYHKSPNIWISSFYIAFGRIGFAFSVSWVIYVCLTSGGPVNQILSFKIFIPLSRLTYCAYLVHPIVLTVYYQNLETPFNFSQFKMVVLYLGIVTVSFAVAFATALLFEFPIMGLENAMKKWFREPRTQRDHSRQQ